LKRLYKAAKRRNGRIPPRRHRYLPNKPSGNTHNEPALPQTGKCFVRSYQGYVKKPHQPLHAIRRNARSLSRRQAQNPVIKDTVYSSYGNSDKMSHLDGLGLRMAHIAAQNYSTGKQSVIHVIDCETDSVYHLREWDRQGIHSWCGCVDIVA